LSVLKVSNIAFNFIHYIKKAIFMYIFINSGYC